LAGSTVAGTSTLSATGHVDVSAPAGQLSATRFTGTPITAAVDATAAGLPASLTADQIAAMNNGRLPVGVRAGAAGQGFDVGYLDTVTPTISVDTATGVVLGVDLRLVRTVQVSVPGRGSVSAGTVLDASAAADPGAVASGLTRVADLADRSVTHQVVGQVLPGLLVVFAAVLLAFGVPKLRRPGAVPPAANPPADPTNTADPLADAGVARRSGD
jgi:high-affinity iron transporter